MSVKLSYSSMKTLQSCEQKYHFYKVSKIPKDADVEESEAMGLGKAFHHVLEHTVHKSWNEELLIKAMVEHKVDEEEKELLAMMLDKYLEFRKASGLTVVKCEFGIETSSYIGFIDAIAIDKVTKTWWLIDLKTAGRHDPNLIPQLAKDMQVGLYSHFVSDIENALPELEGYEWVGFRYCQVIKSKATTQKGLMSGVKVYEMEIPARLIDSEGSWSLFSEVQTRAEELHKGEAPRKNYSGCFNYFRPCEYFSQCHGHLFSKGSENIKVLTIENLNDGDLL